MDGSENKTAVDAAVCGLQSDGVLSLLDVLYVYGTNSPANALLNWISTSFPGTNNANGGTACAFAANAGYTGNGTCYLGTGFNPSTAAGHFQLNSSSFGLCDLTANSSTTVGTMGGTDGTNFTEIILRGGTPAIVSRFNVLTAATVSTSITTTKGGWVLVRQVSGSYNIYTFASGNIASPSAASSALPNASLYVLAVDSSGTAANQTTDQVGYAFIGGSLSSAQVTALLLRLHTYFGTVGAPSGC